MIPYRTQLQFCQYVINLFNKSMKSLNKNTLILFVLFSKNNILCTLANLKGKTLISTSGGVKRTKGIKKNTNSSIFTIIKILYQYSKKFSYLTLYIRIKGTNKNKNIFIKYLKSFGFNVLLIQEKLSLPYGGCKLIKSRRL